MPRSKKSVNEVEVKESLQEEKLDQNEVEKIEQVKEELIQEGEVEKNEADKEELIQEDKAAGDTENKDDKPNVKITTNKVEVAKVTAEVIIFKATRKLTQKEHQELSKRVRFENEKSGVKVVLMPLSCDLEENTTVTEEPETGEGK